MPNEHGIADAKRAKKCALFFLDVAGRSTHRAPSMSLVIKKKRGQASDLKRTFGPDRAFGRVIPFESTPNGWNLTVELEAPNDVNCKLQEIMDIMMTENR